MIIVAVSLKSLLAYEMLSQVCQGIASSRCCSFFWPLKNSEPLLNVMQYANKSVAIGLAVLSSLVKL